MPIKTEPIQIPIEVLDQATEQVDQINTKLSGATEGVRNISEKISTIEFGAIAGGIGFAVEKGVELIAKQIKDVVKLSKERPELFTTKELQNIKEYSGEVEELKDEFTKLKIELVTGVVPVLVDIIRINKDVKEEMESGNSIWQARIESAKDFAIATDATTESINSYDKAILALNQNVELSDQQHKNLEASIKSGQAAIKEREEQIKSMTKANQAWLDMIGSITNQYDSYSKVQENIDEQMQDIEQQINDLIANGLNPESEKILELKDKWTELQQKQGESTDQFIEDTNRRKLAMLEEALSAGGLTEEETRYLEDLGIAWGVYTETAVEAARNARAEVDLLVAQFNELPTEKTMRINIETAGSFDRALSLMNFNPSQQRQHGGPVGQGTPYMVGERGPEMFIPSQSGSIVPNNQFGGIDEERLGRVIVSALLKAMG